jgi:hypothetical protein
LPGAQGPQGLPGPQGPPGPAGTLNLEAGTGIEIVNNTIRNTLPDREVRLLNGTGITVTGTYPEFTINSTAGPGGNVTADGGEANYVPKFNGPTSLVKSSIYDNGTNVGIGVTGTPPAPQAKLHVEGGSVLLNGTAGATPTDGAGTRFMWIPAKGAMRAGTVGPDAPGAWNDGVIGINSIGLGLNAQAQGNYSLSLGVNNRTEGLADIAIGQGNVTNGSGAFALGQSNTITKSASYALGFKNVVDGNLSVAVGSENVIGVDAPAASPITNFSAAHGVKNEVRAGNAFAFGTLVTAAERGAFVLGDRSFDPFVGAEVAAARASAASKSWGENTMTMRFNGGYRFYTNRDGSTFVSIARNRNGVLALEAPPSDVNCKENFRPVNGEALLGKIGGFRLTTWNYKGEDARRYRHYGPMAQDFYAAFGHDGVGTIGTDTTIATLDLNGLNFTAIKALVDRTEALRQKDAELEQKNRELEALMTQLREQQEANTQLRNQLAGQQAELSAQQARSDKLESDLEAIKKHLGLEETATADGNGKETADRKKGDRRRETTSGGDAVK